MAATFNAPLASVLLAVELLLFEWRPRSFVPVAAAVANEHGRAVAAARRGADLRPSTRPRAPAPAIAELLCVGRSAGGLLAVAATGLVYASEDAFPRLPMHWMWWPAIGGLIIGAGRADRAPRARCRLRRHRRAAHRSSRDVADRGDPRREDPDLEPLAGLGHLRRRARAGVHDRRRARRARGAHPARSPPGFWALIGLAAVLGGVMRSPFTGVVFSAGAHPCVAADTAAASPPRPRYCITR